MRQALFAQTGNLRHLVEQVRARERTATLLLESRVADRMASVLSPDNPDGADALENVARAIVAVMARDRRHGNPIDPIWDMLDEIGPSAAIELLDEETGDRLAKTVETWKSELPDKERRCLQAHLTQGFQDQRDRDPATHARLAHLLRGGIPGTRARSTCTRKSWKRAYGRRVVLTSTLTDDQPEHDFTRAHARDLLQLREALISLIPREHRPARRLSVPGGVTCTDLEGPRLSWIAISGRGGPDEEGAFEAHLLSCDICFEFHYRSRWALDVLRSDPDGIVGRSHEGGRENSHRVRRGGWRTWLARLPFAR